MSAWVVSKTHIDAMLTAGMELARPYGLRWLWPAIGPDDERDAFERGQPWGPRAIELSQERRRELTPETAGRVGAMLWAENMRSVNHRYNEEDWEEPYVFAQLPGFPDPVIVLSAIRCYEYQSCEHPEWERSEAKAFCDALTSAAINKLPGMDDAPWGIDDPHVFGTAQRII